MKTSCPSVSTIAIAIVTAIASIPAHALAVTPPSTPLVETSASSRQTLPLTGDRPSPVIFYAQTIPTTVLQQQGTLASGDAVLESDGSLYDAYTFQGQAGQQVTITLNSQEFDTYLILNGADGGAIAQNDDVTANNRNSSLTLTLPSSGTYTVLANSYDSSGRGRYTLTVTSLSATTHSTSPANAATGTNLPGPGSLPDNTRFAQQNFSQTLFQQIHRDVQVCADNGLDQWCSYTQRYIFQDAILLLQKESTASVGYTLALIEPVSQQQGLAYARILDDHDSFSFATPASQSNAVITYEDCHFEDDIFLCTSQLHLTSDGKVSSIDVYYSSP